MLRTFWGWLALLEYLWLAVPNWACEHSERSHEESRPNIIVIVVDDLGVMDSSVPFLSDATGQPQRFPLNEFYRTPNLERLSSQGMRFNQFQAMSVCSPTRLSLLTGQNAARHRTTTWINPTQNNRGEHGPPAWNWNGLRSESVSLPKLLRAADYRTIHVGKGHLGPVGSEGEDPTRVGFDVNIGGSAIGQPGSYYGLKQFGAGGTHPVPHLDAYHNRDVFLTEALTREALTQIDRSIEADQPFFLSLCHYAVHSPFQADSRFSADYAQSGQPKQAQAFATLVAGVDDSLGSLLRHLEERGIAEQTLIFFLGDNGSDAPLGEAHVVACAAPLRGKKGTHYEGGMRAPLVAAWAKPNPNHVCQQRLPIQNDGIQTKLTTICDLFPTILDITGIEKPANHAIDGQSLCKLMTSDDQAPGAAGFVMHFPHEHRSSYFTVFRTERWKVVYHYFPGPHSNGQRYELYDLNSDPYESLNLAEQEVATLRTMMQELTAQLQSFDALYPQNELGEPLQPIIP